MLYIRLSLRDVSNIVRSKDIQEIFVLSIFNNAQTLLAVPGILH